MTYENRICHMGDSYETESFTFPGGELQVRVPDLPDLTGDVSAFARLQYAEDFVRLLLTTDIIRRHHRGGQTRLVVLYFPDARHDRVMRPGEVFSPKAVARVVNFLGFDEVVVCDPHSDVTPARVENVRVISQAELVAAHDGVGRIIHSGVTVVAPDAGAAKKAFTVARHFGLPLLAASEVRNPKTGEITDTHLHGDLGSRSALIVDDICDGGRTFVELAKVLRLQGAARVYLYGTHGTSAGWDNGKGMTAAVRAFAAAMRVEERSVWYWLSGDPAIRPMAEDRIRSLKPQRKKK